MSNRDKHRVKVRIEWDEVKSASGLGIWASKYLSLAIDQVLPKNGDLHGCQLVNTVDRPTWLAQYGIRRYTREYEFRYKRSNTSSGRETEWHKIFAFCLRMKEIVASAPEIMKVTLNIDLQPNHLPWTFVDNRDSPKVNWLAHRQGAKDYLIQLPEPVQLPGEKRTRIVMNKNETHITMEQILADEIRIIGEPRCAYKVYKHFEQIERGVNKLGSIPRSKRFHHALGDLVTVIYRNTKGVDKSWQVLTKDNNHVYGDFMKYVLPGRELDRNPAIKLDLDYSVYDLTASTITPESLL